MISRYGIFCQVLDNGSFTKAAAKIGYSQSSVSQTVRALEQELGVTLLDRRRDGVALTSDGAQFMPYIQAIAAAENALEIKRREMEGLESAVVSIGTFSSVSRILLPRWMEGFKALYPNVRFILRQGEYTSISHWIREDRLDLGFVSTEVITDLEVLALHRDEMMALLPPGHPLASRQSVSLAELAREPFILLDEGEHSLLLDAFAQHGLTPRIEYTVTDDYTILTMVREGMGVSAIYDLVLNTGFAGELVIRPIREHPSRTVGLAWKNRETLPLAARRFTEHILRNLPEE